MVITVIYKLLLLLNHSNKKFKIKLVCRLLMYSTVRCTAIDT